MRGVLLLHALVSWCIGYQLVDHCTVDMSNGFSECLISLTAAVKDMAHAWINKSDRIYL